MKFRLLTAEEIECRVARVLEGKRGSGVMLLLYKDARCDMNILDEAVGAENWQRSHELINGNLFCNVGIRCGDEWVWKQDVGTESNTEKEKGQASDSFKRACFNWGIGRELYTAPNMIIWDDDLITGGKCYETFDVEDIQYIDRKISYVRVKAKKLDETYEFGIPAEDKKRQDSIGRQPIGTVKAAALLARCANEGIDVKKLMERCKITRLEDMTERVYSNVNVKWAEVKETCGNDRES